MNTELKTLIYNLKTDKSVYKKSLELSVKTIKPTVQTILIVQIMLIIYGIPEVNWYQVACTIGIYFILVMLLTLITMSCINIIKKKLIKPPTNWKNCGSGYSSDD